MIELQCKCKDCSHWEVIENKRSKQRYLYCVTCKRKFPVTIHVPVHDHLHWKPL